MPARRCSALLAVAVIAWPARMAAAAEIRAEETRPPALAPGQRDRERLGWFIPDFAKLQTGGYAGTLTIGVGYAAADDILNLALFYGWVPPTQGRSVQSLHATLTVRPFELERHSLRFVPIYAGLGGLHTWAEGYFIELPAHYPPDYYPSTGLYLTAQLGTELDWVLHSLTFERHGVYFELTTLQLFLWRYSYNPDVIELSDIISSSIGYRLAF